MIMYMQYDAVSKLWKPCVWPTVNLSTKYQKCILLAS